MVIFDPQNDKELMGNRQLFSCFIVKSKSEKMYKESKGELIDLILIVVLSLALLFILAYEYFVL